MPNKSLRKKPGKGSLGSAPAELRRSSMAPIAPSLHSNRKIVPLTISGGLFFCVLVLYRTSLSMQSALVSDLNVGRIYGVEVVNEFPHDRAAFTQGLLYAGNNSLFESTGLNGHSSVRRVDLATGKVLDIHKMPNSYFGEGLTLLGDRLFQVTWLTNTGFIYDRSNLRRIMTFSNHMKDGWGLATDGKIMFGSDGTSTLYHIDPQSFKVLEKHIVKYNGHQVHNLNELEYVNGEVWANVWQTDCIARISSKDGSVLGWVYLPQLRKGLVAAGNTGIDVLNGIAWDEERNRLFVTGKFWPKLYEIKLQVMKESPQSHDIERICNCMPAPVHFQRP